MGPTFTVETLDDEIVAVETWVVKAAGSLLSLFAPGDNMFQRDTSCPIHQDRGDPAAMTGRVSTALAVSALLEYLRFLEESPESFSGHTTTAINQIMAGESDDARLRTPNLLNTRRTVESSIESVGEWVGSDLLTEYSSPHYLQASVTLALYSASSYSYRLARQASPSDNLHGERARDLEERANTVSSDLLASITRMAFKARHGSDGESEAESYMVAFHAARAQDVADARGIAQTNAHLEGVDLWGVLAEPIRSHLLSQLGYYDAGMGSRFRVGDLVFSAALLDRLEAGNARQLVARAVEIIGSMQQADGSWSSLPVISRRDEILQISSYDIAYALSCLLLNQFRRREWSLADKVLLNLHETFELVQTMRETVRPEDRPPSSGWGGEASRVDQVVTGWCTARVLSFMLRYRESLLMYRQHCVLGQYEVLDSRPLQGPAWYDLIPISTDGSRNGSRRKARARLDRVSDPHRTQRLADTLSAKLVMPVFDNHLERPLNASFLLSGPPGTRKTSLVRAIAEGLNWPMVVLSPPDFLREGGIAGLQVVASGVFRDLLRLRRVVVLFDECEELFRKRDMSEPGAVEKRAPASARTDSAFLTAAMLPRLQALRDNRWTIFALATNVLDVTEVLDEAVVREGRFDFALDMPHPEEDAQVAYVKREMAHTLSRGKLPSVSIKDEDAAALIQRGTDIIIKTLEDLSPDYRKRIPWALLDLAVRRTGRSVMQPNLTESEIRSSLESALIKSLKVGPRNIFDPSVA